MSNTLFKLRDPHPALDVGTPILIGPSITGSVSLTSSAATAGSIYPNISISCAGLDTQTDSVYIIPLFPTGTVPRRFSFEMIFSNRNYSGYYMGLYFIIGTAISSSANFNGMAFSFKGDKFSTISNGVFSSSLNDFGQVWFWDGNYLNYIKKEFEFRTQTPSTGSELSFRCREFTCTSKADGTYQYDTIYKSHVNFPWQKFPESWNNKTFNKLFLGISCVAPDTGNTYIDTIRIQKHVMDWDT